jgi:hypothetical protein
MRHPNMGHPAQQGVSPPQFPPHFHCTSSSLIPKLCPVPVDMGMPQPGIAGSDVPMIAMAPPNMNNAGQQGDSCLVPFNVLFPFPLHPALHFPSTVLLHFIDTSCIGQDSAVFAMRTFHMYHPNFGYPGPQGSIILHLHLPAPTLFSHFRLLPLHCFHASSLSLSHFLFTYP